MKGLGAPTLAGLHDRSVAAAEDDAVAAAVRDGDESIEVVLVRRADNGYLTLAGRPLGPDGAVAVSDPDVLDEVARCSVRLPPYAPVTAAATQTLRPLPGWGLDPWLRHARALCSPPTSAPSLGATASATPASSGSSTNPPERPGEATPRGRDNVAAASSTTTA